MTRATAKQVLALFSQLYLYSQLNTNSHRFFVLLVYYNENSQQLAFFLLAADSSTAFFLASRKARRRPPIPERKHVFTAYLAPRSGNLLNVALGDAPRSPHVTAATPRLGASLFLFQTGAEGQHGPTGDIAPLEYKVIPEREEIQVGEDCFLGITPSPRRLLKSHQY